MLQVPRCLKSFHRLVFLRNVFSVQAIAHRDRAGLRGGCALFNKDGSRSVPFGHHERRLAVAPAPGSVNASAADHQAANPGRCRSISEEFPWEHGPPPGLHERRSRLRQGSHGLIVSDGEEQADARTDSTRLTSEFGAT